MRDALGRIEVDAACRSGVSLGKDIAEMPTLLQSWALSGSYERRYVWRLSVYVYIWVWTDFDLEPSCVGDRGRRGNATSLVE